MRRVILEEWISLDGYVSDKKGQLNFFASSVRTIYSDVRQVKFLDTVDTILFGRKTYQQFVNVWPQRETEKEPLANTMNKVKKLVFSNTITNAPWGKWPGGEIITADPIPTIKSLKLLPGKNMVLWGSVSLAQTLMKEDLIDEYQLHLCPELTSGGQKLFTEEINPTTLKIVETRLYDTGTIFLNYQRVNSL